MREKAKHTEAVLDRYHHEAAGRQSRIDLGAWRAGPVAAPMDPDEDRQTRLANGPRCAVVLFLTIFRAALGIGTVPTNIGLQAGRRRLVRPENSRRQGDC